MLKSFSDFNDDKQINRIGRIYHYLPLGRGSTLFYKFKGLNKDSEIRASWLNPEKANKIMDPHILPMVNFVCDPKFQKKF